MASALYVTNMTVTATLSRKIEVAKLDLPTCKSNKFFPHAVLYRNCSIKGTCIIFATGKVVCVGCKSLPNAKGLLKCLSEYLTNMNVEHNLCNIQVRSIAGTCHLGWTVNLYETQKLIKALKYNTFLEPELFCGLVVKITQNQTKISIILFESGRILITGAKVESDLEKYLSLVIHNVVHYRKPQCTGSATAEANCCYCNRFV